MEGIIAEKYNWASFGLVLNSSWAGFVSQIWQPCAPSVAQDSLGFKPLLGCDENLKTSFLLCLSTRPNSNVGTSHFSVVQIIARQRRK